MKKKTPNITDALKQLKDHRPFVEKDKCVGWKDADGKATFWIYKKGRVYENDKLVFDMAVKPYKIKKQQETSSSTC